MAKTESIARLVDQGDNVEADRLLSEVVRQQGKCIEAIATHIQHTRVLMRLNRPEEGFTVARRGLSYCTEMFGRDHIDTIWIEMMILSYTIDYERDRKKLLENERISVDVLLRCRRIFGPDHHLTKEAIRIESMIRKRID